MRKPGIEIVKLLSVILTREKQMEVEEEIERYVTATNWTIKEILRRKLYKHEDMVGALREEFGERFNKSQQYLNDVVMTARGEIGRHRRLAKAVRSLQDKTPHLKLPRMILSQPLIGMNEKTLLLTLRNGTRLPIPFDKRSRNRSAEEIRLILKGSKEGEINKNIGRVRLTFNREGYLNIDIQADITRPVQG